MNTLKNNYSKISNFITNKYFDRYCRLIQKHASNTKLKLWTIFI